MTEKEFSKSELQKYTKDELIYFITETQFFLPKGSSIKKSVARKRYCDIMEQIEKSSEEDENLYSKYKNKQIMEYEYVKQIIKKHKEWEIMWEKQRKIAAEL